MKTTALQISFIPLLAAVSMLGTAAAEPGMKWRWNSQGGPEDPRKQIADSMNRAVATWNEWSEYDFTIGTTYGAGTPTADSSYCGQIRFGRSRSFRTAMHESSHWMGTGTVPQWSALMQNGRWTGTYANRLIKAYHGPGAHMGGDRVHYWPYGANFDREGVNAPRMVGIIGAFRRDMNLPQGDRSIGIAPGTYRLRNRETPMILAAGKDDASKLLQSETIADASQEWEVARIPGTRHFTLRNVATGLHLGAAENGCQLTPLNGQKPTPSQAWEIQATDSFFFRLINPATRRALVLSETSDMAAQWTFLHKLPQFAPSPGVISQGRPAKASSQRGGTHAGQANNGVPGDHWEARSSTFPQWWRVDLGASMPISRVATDWLDAGGRSFAYKIELSNDDKTYTVAADRTGDPGKGTTEDPVKATARYVRITLTGGSGGAAGIRECRVHHAGEPLQLLSLNRPATASGQERGHLAVDANDGDSEVTRWTAPNGNFPAWWQVDLGRVRPVEMAMIDWLGGTDRVYRYKIEGSSDGKTFTTLADRTGNTQPGTTLDALSGQARYVRVTVTGSSRGWAAIQQVGVFGSP